MPRDSRADALARDCVKARLALRRAAQVLHDAGSLLTVAGMHLQLLRMDHPETEPRVATVSQTLEDLSDRLRTLTQELEPSPVRRAGLENALRDLAGHGRDIGLRYKATTVLPPEVADAFYHAVAGSAASASAGERVAITVSGSARSITARVSYSGRPSNGRGALAAAALVARHAGLAFEIKSSSSATKRGTIVAIGYGVQRTSRG